MPADLKNVTFRAPEFLIADLQSEAGSRAETLGMHVTLSKVILDVLLKHKGYPGVLPEQEKGG
jgi:hypothetical protein